MSNDAVIARPEPHDFAPALLALLRSMVKQRREEYKTSDTLIAGNLSTGERRRGKAKLKLSPPKFVEHMEAVETRRRSDRELQVLVPLLRCVVCCVQMKSKTFAAFSEVLNPFRAKLAIWTCATGKKGTYEKPLAESLIAAFPDLLKASADLQPEQKAEKPRVDESRLKLYNKITAAGLLDGKELEELRVVFWG